MVLLGRNDADNTVAFLEDELGGNKALVRYINSRFAEIPAWVRVSVSACRSSTRTDREQRASDVKGFAALLDAVAPAYSVKVAPGVTVRCWYLDPEKFGPTTVRFGDNVPDRTSVTASTGDGEMSGLVECYQRHSGNEALAKLRSFGLNPLVGKVMLDVHIKRAKPNAQRTDLELANGAPIPWAEYAEAFRDQMPVELARLCDEAVASRDDGTPSAYRQKLAETITSFVGRLARFAGVGTRAVKPGGLGATEHRSGESVESTGTGRTKSSSATATAGSLPGGFGTTVDESGASPDAKRRVMVAPEMPSAVWLRPSEVGPELAGRAAMYDATSNTLTFNSEFELIAIETEYHLDGRGTVSKTDRVVAEQLVRERILMTVTEAVMSIRGLATRLGWAEIDVEMALSSEALTAAACTPSQGFDKVRQTLSREIGAMRR